VSVYLTLAPDQLVEDVTPSEESSESPIAAPLKGTTAVSALRASGRLLCFRDLLKWAGRINANLHLEGAQLANLAFQVRICSSHHYESN
jgi:hypothetical protein